MKWIGILASLAVALATQASCNRPDCRGPTVPHKVGGQLRVLPWSEDDSDELNCFSKSSSVSPTDAIYLMHLALRSFQEGGALARFTEWGLGDEVGVYVDTRVTLPEGGRPRFKRAAPKKARLVVKAFDKKMRPLGPDNCSNADFVDISTRDARFAIVKDIGFVIVKDANGGFALCPFMDVVE